MTPPGDGLEFLATRAYLARLEGASDIDAAIREQIKNRPQGGVLLAPGVWEMSIAFPLETFVVFFTRRGNRIGLNAVYPDSEAQLINLHRTELRNLFGKGGK